MQEQCHEFLIWAGCPEPNFARSLGGVMRKMSEKLAFPSTFVINEMVSHVRTL
jgi:hypothetical protein